MQRRTRDVLDKAFTWLGYISIALMAVALILILAPMIWGGSKAFFFRGTIEFRRLQVEEFDHGDPEKLEAEVKEVMPARKPVYDALVAFENATGDKLDRYVAFIREKGKQIEDERERERLEKRLGKIEEAEELSDRIKHMHRAFRRLERNDIQVPDNYPTEIDAVLVDAPKVEKIKQAVRYLLGPLPGEDQPTVLYQRYGSTRWDKATEARDAILYEEKWVLDPDTQLNKRTLEPRIEQFRGTPAEQIFTYIESDENLAAMLKPRFTFYWRFLTDESRESHYYGGVWGEMVGTCALTLGAILFAVPMGVIAAIYLCEYAKPSPVISIVRTCVSTLAGVPSIVFGLFGLAFFLNAIHISPAKSVLAGSLTLGLMILPTIIRASEEAILAVPTTYKEAALGLGAGRWHTVLTVVLPAALPGILTGIVISMGRAAGETAPIIFTAAVATGGTLKLSNLLSVADNPIMEPTLALPWGIYMMCTENIHAAHIRHNQFGMVCVLVGLVLVLNLAAIILRARVSKKLRG